MSADDPQGASTQGVPSSTAPAAPRAGASPAALALLSLLFVLSGSTGLAYEVVWFKRFSQLFGASSPATAQRRAPRRATKGTRR